MQLQNYWAEIPQKIHDVSHVCALLPRVGLKEVNTTEVGRKQP
jgi:hypothetical protein